MATALQTIGKFIVKKKVGEQDQIFGRCVTVHTRNLTLGILEGLCDGCMATDIHLSSGKC